jgi:hypothetical protein
VRPFQRRDQMRTSRVEEQQSAELPTRGYWPDRQLTEAALRSPSPAGRIAPIRARCSLDTQGKKGETAKSAKSSATYTSE